MQPLYQLPIRPTEILRKNWILFQGRFDLGSGKGHGMDPLYRRHPADAAIVPPTHQAYGNIEKEFNLLHGRFDVGNGKGHGMDSLYHLHPADAAVVPLTHQAYENIEKELNILHGRFDVGNEW